MSALVATGISSKNVAAAWPDLWPLLRPAYEKSDLKTDLLLELISRRCTMWGIYANNAPVAGIVSRLWTREDKQPPEKHAHLWLVGGSRLLEWVPDFLPKFTEWAKAEGCVAVTGNGRRGWDRIVTKFGGYRIEPINGRDAWRLDL